MQNVRFFWKTVCPGVCFLWWGSEVIRLPWLNLHSDRAGHIWVPRTKLRELEEFTNWDHVEMWLSHSQGWHRGRGRRQRPVFQIFKGVSLWRAGNSNAPAFWAHHVEKPGILAILSTTSNTLLWNKRISEDREIPSPNPLCPSLLRSLTNEVQKDVLQSTWARWAIDK